MVVTKNIPRAGQTLNLPEKTIHSYIRVQNFKSGMIKVAIAGDGLYRFADKRLDRYITATKTVRLSLQILNNDSFYHT
jgi:hypothetical protein